ncbi:MAG: DUF4190 domain-containing protein [Pseudomonadota bacterium]
MTAINQTADVRPDHNSLGKAAFVVGLIALAMSFIPFIGFVSWLLAPLAILFGLIALRRPPRSLAIAGLVTGGVALLVCIMWVNATKAGVEAWNKDTFHNTGKPTDNTEAPIMNTSVKGLWKELDDNKVAAGQKYGGHRLAFSNEKIEDFGGDAATPTISFEGGGDGYLTYLVAASFSASDGKKIASLKKGQKISFVCTDTSENIGDGYSLSGCSLK